MLVLTRKTGERILIGEEIAVTVVRISQGTVRIGIDAPRNLSVVRERTVPETNDSSKADTSERKVLEVNLLDGGQMSVENHSSAV